MASVRQLRCFIFLMLISLVPFTLAASTSSISLPGCSSKCGNISIPYPFGMGNGCYRDGFDITCDESTTPPKAYLSDYTELTHINIVGGEVVVYHEFSYICFSQINISNTSTSMLSLPQPFLYSHQQNKFIAIGCSTLAYITTMSGDYTSGCVSYCFGPYNTTGDGGSCNGMGCCETVIPAGLTYFVVFWDKKNNRAWRFNPCNYAMLVKDDWYKFQVRDLSGFDFYERNKNGVPVVLDWAIRDNGTCQDGVKNTVCRSSHSFCYNTSNGVGYLCQCKQGYQGNPYLTGGCVGKLFFGSDFIF